MNIPLLNRLNEMFRARKESHHYGNDELANYMFSFVKEDVKYDETLCMSLEVRDIIEECQTYIFRDRPLQVNAIIEADLSDEYDKWEDMMASLRIQDTAVMSNLIHVREYIYQ